MTGRRVIPLRWPAVVAVAVVGVVGLVAFTWPFFVTGDFARDHGNDAPVALRRAPRAARGRLPRRGDGRPPRRQDDRGPRGGGSGRRRAAPAQRRHGRARADVLRRHRRRPRARARGRLRRPARSPCTTGALLTGGVGPWLPFQMICAGGIGLGAGLLPGRAGGRAERWVARGLRPRDRARLRALHEPLVLAVPRRQRPQRHGLRPRGAPAPRTSPTTPSSTSRRRSPGTCPAACSTPCSSLVAGPALLRVFRRGARRAAFGVAVVFDRDRATPSGRRRPTRSARGERPTGRRPTRPGRRRRSSPGRSAAARAGTPRTCSPHHAVVTYVATGPPRRPDRPGVGPARARPTGRAGPSRGAPSRRRDVAGASSRRPPGPVLVDCLGTWLTAVVDEAGWDDLDARPRHVRHEAATRSSSPSAPQRFPSSSSRTRSGGRSCPRRRPAASSRTSWAGSTPSSRGSPRACTSSSRAASSTSATLRSSPRSRGRGPSMRDAWRLAVGTFRRCRSTAGPRRRCTARPRHAPRAGHCPPGRGSWLGASVVHRRRRLAAAARRGRAGARRHRAALPARCTSTASPTSPTGSSRARPGTGARGHAARRHRPRGRRGPRSRPPGRSRLPGRTARHARGTALAVTALLASRLAPAVACRRGIPPARPRRVSGAAVAGTVGWGSLVAAALGVLLVGAVALWLAGGPPYAAGLVLVAGVAGAWSSRACGAALRRGDRRRHRGCHRGRAPHVHRCGGGRPSA